MKKLSNAQQNVLARMAAGDEAWATKGIYASIFWKSNLSDRSPGFPTVLKLKDLGLIEDYAPPLDGGKYRISAAGLALFGEPRGGSAS